MTYPLNVKYGSFPGVCQVHGGNESRFGTLVDPNGHRWLVCSECIDVLWGNRQQMNLEELEKERQENAVNEAMRRLRESLLGSSDG
jgi:hypothetical protein